MYNVYLAGKLTRKTPHPLKIATPLTSNHRNGSRLERARSSEDSVDSRAKGFASIECKTYLYTLCAQNCRLIERLGTMQYAIAVAVIKLHVIRCDACNLAVPMLRPDEGEDSNDDRGTCSTYYP